MPQQLGEQAHVARIQMRNQDKGYAAIRRHIVKELLKGFEAAGGCANTDDGVIFAIF